MTCLDQQHIFDLAKQMQAEYDFLNSESDADSDVDSVAESDVSDDDNACKHIHTIEKGGSYVCTGCGNILSAVVYDQEAYAEGGGGASRYHHRKFEERGILRELDKHNIPRHIKIAADDEYHRRVENSIKRGRNRESLIFACVLKAYKHTNNPKNPHLIAELLQTNRKTMSRGVKYYHNFTKIKQKFRPVDVEASRNVPVDIQHKILDALINGAPEESLVNLKFLEYERGGVIRESPEAVDLLKNYIKIIKEVKNIEIPESEPIQLYKDILNNFSNEDYIGDRHNTKSLTAGIVYYVLKKTHHISKRDFKNMVGISEITITKVVQEITELMTKTRKAT